MSKEQLLKILELIREICLQKLKESKMLLEKLEKKGDLSGTEKIQKEVIEVYEKIFLTIDKTKYDLLKNDVEIEKVDVNFLEKFSNELLEKNSYDKKYIEELIKIREKLKDNSGSKVLKRFYDYQLKEYKKIYNNIKSTFDKILDEEEKLNAELANTVQECDQLKIVDKLISVRAKYGTISPKLLKYSEEIKKIENILEKKWYYEIYGTIEENVLKKIFEEEFK